jgi:oligopeptide transport system ATP-binding protein
MGRQVFQHDADQLGLWIVKVDEITHALGEVAGDALVCDLDRAPGPVGIEEDKHVGRAVAAILAVVEAMEPTLLIADEPTTALDATIQSQIIDLLVDLTHRHGTALLLVTHNIALVAEIADQIGVMYGGTIVELGPKGRVLDAPRHPYTAALVDSIPRLDEPDRPLNPIPGMMPGLAHLPKGCPFHPRCTRARLPDCLVRPALMEVVPGHRVACHFALEPSA